MTEFKPIPLTETQMAELFRLRQRVAELEKDCDEYHQVALNHIHANENLTAERDALNPQRDELLAAMNKLSGMKLNMIADGIVDKAIASVKEKA